MSRHSLSSKRYIFFLATAYVLAPALLAWIGYTVAHYDHVVRVTNNLRYQIEEMNASSTVKSFYDMPALQLTVNGSGNNTGIMKINLSLEVNQKDLLRVPDYEPRIIERVMLYLRGKSFEDMRDPSGMRTLREGLTEEISRGAIPINISDVVVRELVFE